MEEIVTQVSERTGLSEEQARLAVTMVLGWVKEKLPAEVQPYVDGVLGGQAAAGSDLTSAVTGALGGLLGGD